MVSGSQVPRFDAPRASPPVARAEEAVTVPREGVPVARPPRQDWRSRNRYRARVADDVAERAGFGKRRPALTPEEVAGHRGEVSRFLASLPAAERDAVSARDVRRLFVVWDVSLVQAVQVAAAAAQVRRVNTPEYVDPHP